MGGKDASIAITAGGGLSKEEIKAAQEEAAARKQEDMARREKIEAVNQADNLIHQAKKAQTEAKNVSETKLKDLEEKLTTLTDIINNVENYKKDRIEEACNDLQKALLAVTSEQYQQAGEQQQGERDNNSPNNSSLYSMRDQYSNVNTSLFMYLI